jgi:hypothetical protein
MQAEFRREGASAVEAAAKAEETVGKTANQLVFGRVPAKQKARRQRGKPEAKVLYFRSLFDAVEDDSKAIVPATEQQPVQLAMFAL